MGLEPHKKADLLRLKEAAEFQAKIEAAKSYCAAKGWTLQTFSEIAYDQDPNPNKPPYLNIIAVLRLPARSTSPTSE